MLPKSHFRKRKIGGHFGEWTEFIRKNKPGSWGVVLILCVSFLGRDFMSQYSDFFRMSLIVPTGIPYEGTTFPIKEVPDWVSLTDSERYMTYDQIPRHKFINIPTYNVRDLIAGKNWQNATDSQRNAYITYPVPHLGNYMLDGTEYSGSHPGIDIKAPKGTPVYASTAGKVSKVDSQPTGFGNHVVIQSDQVPDPEQPGKKITVFTTYAHLSETKVREGDIVGLGDLVGLVGQSGMATADHLHWQVDRHDAPFHGYWPFMWSDVQSAGFSSYFEAVKGGLNQDKAMRYTIHPAEMVVKGSQIDDTNLVVSAGIEALDEVEIAPETPKIVEPESETVVETIAPKLEIPESPESVTRPTRSWRNQFELSFGNDGAFIPDQSKTITLNIEHPEKLETGIVRLSSTLKDLTEISPSTLTLDDIQDGKAQIQVTTRSNQSFRIIAQSPFGEIKSQLLKTQVFADVPADHPYADSIGFLKNKGTVKGYEDGTFGLFKNLTRAEAVKVILDANDIDAHHIPTHRLADVLDGAWFAGWVSSAIGNNIVKGYPDGTFRPGNTMTRAEFLKVAILTAGFQEAENLVASAGFRDVPEDTWFSGFMAFTQKHELLPATNEYFIEPAKPITRGEAAYVIHQLWDLKN